MKRYERMFENKRGYRTGISVLAGVNGLKLILQPVTVFTFFCFGL